MPQYGGSWLYSSVRCGDHVEANNQYLVENTYSATVEETISRGGSLMDAHKEGVVAASMLLAAITGIEDELAKKEVVALNLRPQVS